MKRTTLLESFSLGHGVMMRNRIVMAPITTWAGNDDGTVSAEEEAYYLLRVKDVGLVITGCTHVQQNGIGFTDEFAAYDDKFIPGLTRLAAAAKSGGAPAIHQVFHAGVKPRPDLVSDIVAASAVPGDAGPSAPSVTPRAPFPVGSASPFTWAVAMSIRDSVPSRKFVTHTSEPTKMPSG